MRSTFAGWPAIALAAVACLAAGPAAAQTGFELDPGRAQPEHFGPTAGTTTVPAISFTGLPVPDTTGFVIYIYPGVPGGSISGHVRLDLPNGVEITRLCLVAFDDTWHGNVSVQLIGWEYPGTAGGSPTPSRVMASVTTGHIEEPGMAVPCMVPSPPILVRSTGNLDGDADSGWTGYALRATLLYTSGGGLDRDAQSDGSLSLGAVVVTWRRTVSPAPGTATFPNDVPTTHPFFRFVEALAAAGITGGCAGGSYCPDSPVTRGQMAVFLAAALGLHWAN